MKVYEITILGNAEIVYSKCTAYNSVSINIHNIYFLISYISYSLVYSYIPFFSLQSKEDSVTRYITEVVPLLEVPAHRTPAPQTTGGSRTNIAGGSRTNMNHLLTSRNSLHISKKDLARPLYRKDIFYSGSVLNIQV